MFMDGNFNFSFEPLVSLFFQRREKKLPSASTPLIYIYIRIHKNFHFAISSNNFNFDTSFVEFRIFPGYATQRNNVTDARINGGGGGEDSKVG